MPIIMAFSFLLDGRGRGGLAPFSSAANLRTYLSLRRHLYVHTVPFLLSDIPHLTSHFMYLLKKLEPWRRMK